jgi:hypothetical protein
MEFGMEKYSSGNQNELKMNLEMNIWKNLE